MPEPDSHERRVNRLRSLGDLLDTRFRLPVLGWRIGLDGLIGLVPGIGDTITGALSAYLVYEAHRAGARKRTMLRMVANAAFDFALGLIPVVGDLFDFANKANTRNVRLLVEDIERQTQQSADTSSRRAYAKSDSASHEPRANSR